MTPWLTELTRLVDALAGPVFLALQWVVLAYVVLLQSAMVGLCGFAYAALRRYRDVRRFDLLPLAHGEFNQAISLLVPAYNESAGIVASVRSMLQIDYPRFEIVVINDGSKDSTLQELIQNFDLHVFPEANDMQIPCAEIRAIYRSRRHPHLRVVDKANGGKSDALNAGINCARHGLVCVVDADSILRRDALTRVVKPFLDDSRVIAAGANIAIANGCQISGGQLERIDLGRGFLARVQVLEYIRAFLIGRLGWTPTNSVLIISGAFGLFGRRVVIESGGYRTQTIGEDMELIVRLHERYLRDGHAYRVVSVPEPLCWTEAPESLTVLRSQRTRWQRGLAESLMLHRGLFLHPRSGQVGWIALPFFLAFELLGPVVETFGYLALLVGGLLGWIQWEGFVAMLLLTLSLGFMISALSLLLEALVSGLYPKPRQIMVLAGIALLENLGYRQLVSLWRVQGLWRWMRGRQQHWGTMTRTAALGGASASPPAPTPPPTAPS